MSGGRLAGSEASKTDRGLGALPPELVLGIAVYLPAQAYLALACTSSRMHRFLLADAFAADKAAARTGLAACIHHARWRAAAMALAVTRPDDRNMLWAQVPSPLAGLFDLDPPPLGDSEWLALVEALARVGALTHTGDGVPCWPMAASAVLSGLPDVAKAVFHVSDGVGRAAMVRAVAMVANEALVEWLLLHDDGELALGIDQGVLLRRCALLGKDRAVAGLLACGRVDPAAKDSAAVSHAAENGHLDIVRMLCDDPRTDPSARNNIALYWAATNRHFDIVNELILHPQVDPSSRRNRTLRIAVAAGAVETVALLLADPRVDPTECEALRVACRTGSMAVTNALLAHPLTDPNIALLDAVMARQTDFLAALLAHPQADASMTQPTLPALFAEVLGPLVAAGGSGVEPEAAVAAILGDPNLSRHVDAAAERLETAGEALVEAARACVPLRSAWTGFWASLAPESRAAFCRAAWDLHVEGSALAAALAMLAPGLDAAGLASVTTSPALVAAAGSGSEDDLLVAAFGAEPASEVLPALAAYRVFLVRLFAVSLINVTLGLDEHPMDGLLSAADAAARVELFQASLAPGADAARGVGAGTGAGAMPPPSSSSSTALWLFKPIVTFVTVFVVMAAVVAAVTDRPEMSGGGGAVHSLNYAAE
ncbi:uncharacterized protein AMSG_06817 [Thecamonas trahens ATCC 50062]|uniref:Uncharacterized protein n=1 Tax=Thecamonas trahens ATCC 50062 TaxID=461836 RepID=A0A0L0DDC7_THETB|nr:hypothetical protein AMSG_06817 [Thecamonas trahens ATCC 50062]KNC50334.1 hypothetical protein AMSG_06817 [Thecamonas trahens ATCC 50062]|eukprot:XP_013756880.1 hypothetical protein AMSG_06817 [Thecamonas trahens ATCC 50062]